MTVFLTAGEARVLAHSKQWVHRSGGALGLVSIFRRAAALSVDHTAVYLRADDACVVFQATEEGRFVQVTHKPGSEAARELWDRAMAVRAGIGPARGADGQPAS